jgi:replicative DNA helicase
MNRDQAKDYINQQAPDFLPRASKKGYICPKCGQGSTKGFGIVKDEKTGRYHCFGGCELHEDVLGLYGVANGLDSKADFDKIIRGAADYYGLRLDESEPPRRSTAREDFAPAPAQYQNQPKSEPSEDYTSFFLEAHRALDQTDYHRGLSRSTLDRFNVGYAPSWKHPKAPRMEASPRLIVPTSAESYLARYAGAGNYTNYQGQVENKSKVGKVHIFNAEALQQASRPVFIVEGELDAMSIVDVGGEAVGLGSTSYVKLCLAEVEKRKPSQPLIIALDNDQAGSKATLELENGLAELGFFSYRGNPAGEYKDANDRLMQDRSGLAAAVSEITAEALRAIDEAKAARAKEYREKNAASSYLQDFLNGIAESASTPATPTGFPALDQALDGGLYAGLYTIGAISSLGKTTLTLQIADNIASSGRDVLIFSLEMARTELMAKSISRHTLQQLLTVGASDTRNAKTTRGIMDGKRYAKYSREERELIKTATVAYGQYADHLYILEGIGDIGAAEIRKAVEDHRQATGQTPVIIVDYLQILAPADVRATDKQNTDKAVLELKRISRDYRTPVIAISSLNRENYSAKINMTAFKESGAIEYSADCLIGLQYAGAGSKSFDAEEAATKTPREIEAVILKQRNGRKGDVIPLSYYPMFNYFSESGTASAQAKGKKI